MFGKRSAFRSLGSVVLGAAVAWLPMASAHAAPRKTPYWASLTEDEARMRVGPSLDYPANWVYRRRLLPVKVVQVLGNWRKIEDSTGTQGWMHVRLLSDKPTGIIVREIAELREGPSDTAPVLYRAEPGVVGRLSDCGGGWCAFDIAGQRGYVRTQAVWGNAGTP